MVSICDLYELQELDLQLEKKRAEIAILQGKLGETQELREARTALERENAVLQTITSERKPLELDLQALEDKVRSVEKELYGGKVRSPKELLAREHEMASLKKRKDLLEDQILALMDEIAAQQAKLQRVTQDLKSKTALWQSEQKRFQEDIQRLQSALVALTPQREVLAATISPTLLARYQALRPAKRGVAVAKVQRGLCQGCRIAIPSSDLQRAKAAREIVYCNSCGRILHAS